MLIFAMKLYVCGRLIEWGRSVYGGLPGGSSSNMLAAMRGSTVSGSRTVEMSDLDAQTELAVLRIALRDRFLADLLREVFVWEKEELRYHPRFDEALERVAVEFDRM